MSHSRLSPSTAHVWGASEGCTGYVAMLAQHPVSENPDATEGSEAHAIAAKMLEGLRTREVLPTEGFPANFSEEARESVQAYVDDVRGVLEAYSIFGGPNFGIETLVYCPGIHEESWGTVDSWIYDPRSAHLHIWDYKHGRGVVDVVKNWQLINYASGLLDQIGVDGSTDQYTTVHFRIAQPRAFHPDGPIREWRVLASDLRGYFNTLKYNAEKALGPDPELMAGTHCKYCPVRHKCPAAQRAAMSALEYVASPSHESLNPEALGLELRILRRASEAIEFRLSGVEEEVKSLIKRGETVPGFGLEPTLGRQNWSSSVDEVGTLGDLMGVPLRKPGLITPKQAIKAGLTEDLVSEYSETKQTGTKLVPVDIDKLKQIFK